MEQKENLRQILLRAINKNQLLILAQLENNTIKTITSVLTQISTSEKIPLSTLKLNAKILKELNLITFGKSKTAKLTDFGKLVIQIIGGDPE